MSLNIIQWLGELEHLWGVHPSEIQPVAGLLEEIAACIYDLGLIYEAGGDIDGPLSSLEQLAKAITAAELDRKGEGG